jgi:hypothetical protein
LARHRPCHLLHLQPLSQPCPQPAPLRRVIFASIYHVMAEL